MLSQEMSKGQQLRSKKVEVYILREALHCNLGIGHLDFSSRPERVHGVCGLDVK